MDWDFPIPESHAASFLFRVVGEGRGGESTEGVCSIPSAIHTPCRIRMCVAWRDWDWVFFLLCFGADTSYFCIHTPRPGLFSLGYET